MSTSRQEKRFKGMIIVLSVLVPMIVFFLYLLPKEKDLGVDFWFLPYTNAFINGLTSVFLVLGFNAIKAGKRLLHQRFMTASLFMSGLFLISYVLYHATHESTKYGGEGWMAYLYYFVLISHVLLAIVIVPMILISFVRALSERYDKHKKIARITLPLWLYVTVTGVLVFLMIRPYYG